MPAENRLNKVPGVLNPACYWLEDEAEIIPVEPEQDNACAGKVASFPLLSSAFSIFSAIHLKYGK